MSPFLIGFSLSSILLLSNSSSFQFSVNRSCRLFCVFLLLLSRFRSFKVLGFRFGAVKNWSSLGGLEGEVSGSWCVDDEGRRGTWRECIYVYRIYDIPIARKLSFCLYSSGVLSPQGSRQIGSIALASRKRIRC